MHEYQPHHATRLDQLKGAPLASFTSRASAFVLDFLAASALFLVMLIYGTKLLAYFNLFHLDADLNLKFDLQHWYSILFVVLYFGLFTYWSDGKTPVKWLMKIRVVS
ncbi:MAG: RDD family protein, partial [candidate division KSB1 bacterium]